MNTTIQKFRQLLKENEDPVAALEDLEVSELEELIGAMDALAAKPEAERLAPADEDEAALGWIVYELATKLVFGSTLGFDEKSGANPGSQPNLRQHRETNWCPPNSTIKGISGRLAELTRRIQQLAPGAPNPAFPKP